MDWTNLTLTEDDLVDLRALIEDAIAVDRDGSYYLRDEKWFLWIDKKIQALDGTGFAPDAGHINALPEPIRNYIHDLETTCDPSGMLATIACQKGQIAALVAKSRETEARLAELMHANLVRERHP